MSDRHLRDYCADCWKVHPIPGPCPKPAPSAESECHPAYCTHMQPAPSAEPDYTAWLEHALSLSPPRSLAQLRGLLSRAGLAIVPAAEVPSAEERKVLQACAEAEVQPGVPGNYDPCINRGEWRIAAAELARRAAKEPEINAHGGTFD